MLQTRHHLQALAITLILALLCSSPLTASAADTSAGQSQAQTVIETASLSETIFPPEPSDSAVSTLTQPPAWGLYVTASFPTACGLLATQLLSAPPNQAAALLLISQEIARLLLL